MKERSRNKGREGNQVSQPQNSFSSDMESEEEDRADERTREGSFLTGTRLVMCSLESYGATMASTKWAAKIKCENE